MGDEIAGKQATDSRPATVVYGKPDAALARKPNRFRFAIPMALAVAIISALPGVMDAGTRAYELATAPEAPEGFPEAQAYRQDVDKASVEDAKDQVTAWNRSAACTLLPPAWRPYTAGAMIDATICKSGDVFIRILPPNKKDPKAKFVVVERLLQELAIPIGQTTQAGFAPSRSDAPAMLAIFQGTRQEGNFTRIQMEVICQRMVDQRGLYRRILERGPPPVCRDQVIDTVTGDFLLDKLVDCRTPCR